MERYQLEDKRLWNNFYSCFKSKDVLRDINEGNSKYPFTSALVRIAETDGLEDIQKKYGMLQVIKEVKRFCRKHAEKIDVPFRENVKNLTNCARRDVRSGDYYLAISDIDSIESTCLFRLQKEVSQIGFPDVKNDLLKRMTESTLKLGGMENVYVEVRENP